MLFQGHKRRLEAALEELSRLPRPTDDCPSAEVMLSAVRAELVAEAIEAIGEHALACPSCGKSWRLARNIVDGKLPDPPPGQAAREAGSAGSETALVPGTSLGRWGSGVLILTGSVVAGFLAWQQGCG